MSLTALEIYLKKRNKVIIPGGDGQSPKSDEALALAATFNRNINSLGFTLTPELISALAARSQADIVSICKQAEPVLKQMVGAHRQHKPMYPNFPKQVMEASDLELYLNAITHYWGSFIHDVTGVPVRYLPEYEKDDREALPDAEVKLRVIRLGDEADFNGIFTSLVGANAALSQSDKDIVTWFVKDRRSAIPEILPAAVPQKENLAHLLGGLLEFETPQYLLPHLKTATDVLRVATVMSGGDVSLAKPGKFRKFKRAERRFFLAAINAASNPTEDMLRRPEVFKRLGHGLHAGDYAKQYPKAYQAFQVVRNAEPFDTFNGKVERNLKTNPNPALAAHILTQRPGDFSRRLDHVLRLAGSDVGKILDWYGEVVDGVSTPALVQAFAHFKNRDSGNASRAFFPKGNVAKVQVVEKPLPKLEFGVAEKAAGIIRAALVRRFAKLPPLGRVYLDPALKTQMVPFAVRSASKTLRTIARGSRVPLPECKTLRFFVWWKDGEGRTDLDLSACFLGEDFEYKTAVAYYNLRNSGCCHSGDITSAPNGAAEYIDVDIDVARQNGRYVVMVVNSFTQQVYKDLPECFAGWMARSAPQSGEVFEGRTVQDKIDITADTTVAVPVLFDLKDRAAIWADLALKSTSPINNVRRNSVGITQMAKAIATLPKPTLYDLFSMHAEARGQLVPRGEAETVFGLHEGITPFDQDKIMGEFLA
jgi:hypothetical protein